MHAARDRDGRARASTRLMDAWRDTMRERTALAQAASALVNPADERKIEPDYPDHQSAEEALGAWLAELVRYTLCSESVGIILGQNGKTRLRLVATAGAASSNRRAWWNAISADGASLVASDNEPFQPLARYIYTEDGYRDETEPAVVRLALPLLSGGRRLGLLVVDFVLGERIMPDTLLTARALAQVAASAFDHEHLSRERKRLSATIAQLRRENTNLETAMIQTVHELRGPLTAMRLGSQLAERHLRLASENCVHDTSPNISFTRAMSATTMANQNVDRAERLLADLTDVARIRAGSLEVRKEPCDLAAVASNVVASQRIAWPRRVIHLDLPCKVVSVLADADRVSQVIGNYITNALKYSPSSQPIEVRIEEGAQEARVAVQDHGVGLTPEHRKRVWERFYRGDQPSGAKAEGLGVGLFICRQVVEKIGGRVGVESVPGSGSTFWFTAPSFAG